MTNNSTGAPPRNSTTTTPPKLSNSDLIAWCFAFGVIDVAIIIGNSVAIAVFTRARLLRKRTNYFLFCLAVADIMVGMTSLPMYIHHLVLYIKGRPLVAWAVVYETIDVFFGFASIFALTIISLERLYSVALPNWHRTTPKKIYYALIVLLWTLAAIMAILRILFKMEIVSKPALSITMLVVLFLCLVVIGLAYTVIWIKVKMRFHEKTKKSEEKDRKLAMTLLLVTVIFVITWLPFYIMNIIHALCKKGDCIIFPFNVVLSSKFLHFSNSYVNPVIYAFKMPDFRKELLILFGKNPRSRKTTQMTNGERRLRKSTFRSSESNESAL